MFVIERFVIKKFTKVRKEITLPQSTGYTNDPMIGRLQHVHFQPTG